MVRNSLIGIAAAVALCAGSTATLAQGTAITYQGQLKNSGTAVNSATDMQFSLWTLAVGGTQIGSTVTSLAVPVADGMFTAPVDFGVNPYTSSQNLFLQIAVRNPAGSGSYVPMGSRQLLTPSPFSLATRGINVDAAGNAVTIGNGAGTTFLNLNDIANAKWRLSTNAFQLNFLNDDGGTFNSKMTITNTGNVGVAGAPATADTRFTIHQGYTPLGSQRTNLFLYQPQLGWGTGAEFNNYRFIKTDAASNNEGFFKQFNVAPGGVSIGYPNTPAYNSTDAMYINGSVGVGANAITPGTRLSMGNSLPATNVATFAMYDGGVGNSYGLGMEGGAMTFWAGSGVKAKVRADGVFEVKTLQINGGSDLVEGFDSQTAELEPGTLMVIDPAHPGQLTPSTSAYDSKVAGIVSGAGGVNPGIKMGQDGVMDGKNPIAMTGRVYVKATATNGAIKPGDLLTTSDVAGHAMKASDAGKSQGTVVGKAMSGLDKDTGLVLVLVNLQ